MHQKSSLQRLSGLKWLGILALLSFAPVNGASAALVDFSTVSSVLSCGSASNCAAGAGNVINFSLSTGGSATLQITYSANIENNLNVDPIAASNFGQLFLLCVSCSGQTGSFGLAGATLDLNVAQGSDPFTDSGTFGTGVFSGALTLNNGNFGGFASVLLPGSPASFSLTDGGLMIEYILQQVIGIGSTVSINSATTFQGLIEASEVPTVPLPAASWLFGSVVAAFGGGAACRKRRVRC